MTGTRLVCLMGPTGTGKTEAALVLAEAFGGAVVNVDSRQVYAGLAVLTAQPDAAARARCPHRLYGDTPLDASVSAGAYAVRVRAAVAELAGQGALPLLVGGTGLYFRAVLGGLAPIPPIDPAIRAAVGREYYRLGPREAHARLAAVDPGYAGRIAPTDRQRVTRALEVYRATGRPFGAWHAARDPEAPDYDVLKLGLTLPLAGLEVRLARRVEAMAVGGAIEEVRRALAVYPADAPGLSGIGGPELAAYCAGGLSLEAAKALWGKNTRAYAKRQMTWFRKEPDVTWFAPGEHAGLVRAVAAWLDREPR